MLDAWKEQASARINLRGIHEVLVRALKILMREMEPVQVVVEYFRTEERT